MCNLKIISRENLTQKKVEVLGIKIPNTSILFMNEHRLTSKICCGQSQIQDSSKKRKTFKQQGISLK